MSDVVCVKCRKKFPRTRYNARAKYCCDCSPKKPAQNLPQLKCCHCGLVYGQAKRRNQIYGLETEPCEKCRHIVMRQRKAAHIKWQRKNKQAWSKWGKWLLILEEEARRKNEEENCDYEDHLFTRMRYVSETEINIIRNNTKPTWHHQNEDWWTRIGKPVQVIRHTGFGLHNHDYDIYKPGYYRVELIDQTKDYFESVCSSGMPTASRNATNQRIEYKIDNAYRQGKEKEWKAYLKRKAKEESLDNLKKRHDEWLRNKMSRNEVEFFRTFAMASAVASGE